MNESVQAIVRRAIQYYNSGNTIIGEHVTFSLRDTVEKITAYLNSRHTTGDKDALGRDKPFFNIVVAAANIWFKATDIDRKDIRFKETRQSDVALVFFANAVLQDWMRQERFGAFLNDWGLTMAQYGSAVSKWVKQGGKLIPSVVPWNRLIVDAVDFNAAPKIEKIYKTPAQLRQMKGYNQDVVEKLISATVTRKTISGQNKDTKGDYIELYEVHGELSVATYKQAMGIEPNDSDEKEYRQQMHVVSFLANEGGKEHDDFTLYCGYEEKDPYMITHLIPQDGRTLAIGAVEYLFDAQWMQNHSMKNLKDTLDLSSKLIHQTADKNFVGRNVLNAIETGDILIHAEGQPLTKVDNSKVDVTALQNFSIQWKQLAQEITATPDALRGINPPSGQPYSATALLTQQANSLFAKMTQYKGFAIEDMLSGFIIPFIKTKLNHSKEIMAILSEHDLSRIDSMYVPAQAVRNYNAQAKEHILNGQIPMPFNPVQAQQDVQQQMTSLGNSRPLSPGEVSWAEALKDFEWRAEVDVTNEQSDKQAVLQTLSTLLQTVAGNPMILSNPNSALLFSKILSLTGAVSPMELSASTQLPPPRPTIRVTEGVDYKDLPPDMQQQMLEKIGFQPTQAPQPAPQGAPVISGAAVGSGKVAV